APAARPPETGPARPGSAPARGAAPPAPARTRAAPAPPAGHRDHAIASLGPWSVVRGPWWGCRPGCPQRLLRVPSLCRVGLVRPRQRTTDHGPGTTDTRSAHTTPAPKPPGPLLIRMTRLGHFGHAPVVFPGRRPP